MTIMKMTTMTQTYKLTMKNEDWTNLAMDRRINWDKDKYCQSNSLEELESW